LSENLTQSGTKIGYGSILELYPILSRTAFARPLPCELGDSAIPVSHLQASDVFHWRKE
jgi:hypothetical protein